MFRTYNQAILGYFKSFSRLSIIRRYNGPVKPSNLKTPFRISEISQEAVTVFPDVYFVRSWMEEATFISIHLIHCISVSIFLKRPAPALLTPFPGVQLVRSRGEPRAVFCHHLSSAPGKTPKTPTAASSHPKVHDFFVFDVLFLTTQLCLWCFVFLFAVFVIATWSLSVLLPLTMQLRNPSSLSASDLGHPCS